MANQFLTIKEVARQALPRLIENLVFPNLVYKDYSDTFQKRGDEIQIRKPAKLEAKEFDAAKGVEMQDIDDSQTVTVKLDKIATVDVEISALEGALNIDNLNRQFIEPAAVALAQKINSDGLALYKDIPYVCGTPGTTPSKLEDITAVRKVLNANKVPTSGRRAVWDVEGMQRSQRSRRLSTRKSPAAQQRCVRAPSADCSVSTTTCRRRSSITLPVRFPPPSSRRKP